MTTSASNSSPATMPRILVIDDTRGIHDDFRKILVRTALSAPSDIETELFGSPETQGCRATFEVDSAYQGQEALAMAERALAEGRPYALAFVDIRMPPGWDGIETTARLWGVAADLQVVLCTAYSDYSWDAIADRLGQTDSLVLLKKPFDPVEVLQLAHALCRKWSLTQESRRRLDELDQLVCQRTGELRAANEALVRDMHERQRLEEQLRHSQKMEAIGLLAGGVAHDFNNLLAVIRGNTELVLLMGGGLTEQLTDRLNQVTAAVDRAANLTRQLLAFGRKQMMQSKATNINELVANLTKMLERLISEDIELEFVYAPDLPLVRVDWGLIEQVIVNLVVNARDAMPRGGRLAIATQNSRVDESYAEGHFDARAGHFICLSVRDTGTGIPLENLPRIFEPFFTTKDVGKGTGLGLATAYGIAKQHHGWIEVQSELGQGTEFRVYLPALDPDTACSPVEEARTANPARGHETILLVEDEEDVRKLTRRLLENFGYKVEEAGSGREALEKWGERVTEIDLVLTDMIMPEGVSGRELVTQLRERHPNLKAVFLSGYSGDSGEDNYFERTNSRFLQKPCSSAELMQTVRQSLDGK